MEAFITSNSVCLPETFLDSTIPNDDVNVQKNEYSFIRSDHPNEIKRGGVCMYFKESLPLIRGNDLTKIKDCLVTEINVNNENCFLPVSPGHQVKVMISLNVFVLTLISSFLISITFIQPVQLF